MKGINTYEIVKNGGKVCGKCDKHGNMFVKSPYVSRTSTRWRTNKKGQSGYYCKCKKCGGTKHLTKPE